MTDHAQAVTQRILTDAGISAGMRVLDVGCGHGDVTFLAAQLVGDNGQVVGIDREATAIEVARTRAQERAMTNTHFQQADLAALPSGLGPFDAVVARRVLMYQPDAVACLSRLGEVLSPGGLIVLQEHDSTSMPICRPAMPLHEKVHRWMWKTVAHEGADTQLGFGLAAALTAAGFAVERVRAETTVLTPDQTHTIGTIIRAMLPRMLAAGVATEDEIGADTLDARLAAERRETNGTCVWELIFGAWARKAA